ncbi:MAG: hypothetical protein QF718_07570 [Phycisphaerales bacterium]|jgi:hypothetical protein|nr:hypothetical protein [Phycisphaerales bacterium]
MKSFLLLLLLFPQLVGPQQVKTRVPLIREGTKIIDALVTLSQEKKNTPVTVKIISDGGEEYSLIALPNERLAEIEAVTAENPKNVFRATGNVYVYGSKNFFLIKEVVSLEDHADRSHPTFVPVDPNAVELNEVDFKDSVADIVRDLEEATGSLVRSIRNASDNPIEGSAFREGALISARRCHLVRNKYGAWVAVFVSDSTGLQDPPCTVLPSTVASGLIEWASDAEPSDPVLLSGELLNYHGHGFLILRSWREVHATDHLDN